MAKVTVISLGCSKNLVDSEDLLKRLRHAGMEYSACPEDSDIIMVNTCGFIEDAKRESIQEILNLAHGAVLNNEKKLLVFGCLAERYREELKKEIPEIDAMWGIGREKDIVDYCRDISTGKHGHMTTEKLSVAYPLQSATGSFAYIKIAEGCDRECSFCVIPDIRGTFKSRDPDQICREAESLLRYGKKEVILIAQDITSYGKDLSGYSLRRLIKDIASIDGDFWIRLLYLYPTSIDRALLETMADEEKVCNYVDIPLQHASDKMLKLMGRGGSREYYKRLINTMRDIIPDIVIRTTFIAGFPRETDEDFSELLDFVQKMRFERLGVFPYSREEGTRAYRLKGQIPKHIKKKRYDEIMKIQAAISLEKNRTLIGKRFKALVDESDIHMSIARIYSQAPEIDGVLMVRTADLDKDNFFDVQIEEAYDYDLKGRIVQ